MNDAAPWHPRLASRARLKFDAVARQEMLLFPEAALVLNETGAAILRLCNGERSIDAIVEEILRIHRSGNRAVVAREVNEFLDSIRRRGLLQSRRRVHTR